MVRAYRDFSGNYNVSDYRWFLLRDGNSDANDFQQQYGLLRDDYSPKPAFALYRSLIARYGPPPGRGGGAVSRPRIRLSVRPRRVHAGRRVRFRFRARRASGRAVARATVRFAGRRVRTGRRGRAVVRVRFRRPGVRRARVTKRGYRPGSAHVRVR
jgi:hypothetical protein